MALVESKEMSLGTEMPNFVLEDAYGTVHSRSQLMGEKGLLVIFTCNHCPYALAIWDRVIALADYAETVGISVVTINPNINPDYPDDSPENMQLLIEERGIDFPYLVDATQDVAKAYDAQCTPDLYLMDANAKLLYHGRLDDNWKEPEQVSSQDLKQAMVAHVSGEPVSEQQFPSMGCSIKWC